MSTQPDMLEHALAGDIFETEFPSSESPFVAEAMPWNADRFGDEQIQGLVRQIFLPGWPEPARQVVFCSVDDGDVGEVCLRVSQTLAAQIPGSVALVEAHQPSTSIDEELPTVLRPAGFRPLRDSARRISGHLWRLPRELPGRERIRTFSGMVTRQAQGIAARVRLHGAAWPAGCAVYGRGVAGYLCDGVILVLEAEFHPASGGATDGAGASSFEYKIAGFGLKRSKVPHPGGDLPQAVDTI